MFELRACRAAVINSPDLHANDVLFTIPHKAEPGRKINLVLT